MKRPTPLFESARRGFVRSAFRQIFGRLIRTATDRGIVAVLDARVTRKSYGRLFVESLPRCRILRTPQEAARFWSGAAGV